MPVVKSCPYNYNIFIMMITTCNTEREAYYKVKLSQFIVAKNFLKFIITLEVYFNNIFLGEDYIFLKTYGQQSRCHKTNEKYFIIHIYCGKRTNEVFLFFCFFFDNHKNLVITTIETDSEGKLEKIVPINY